MLPPYIYFPIFILGMAPFSYAPPAYASLPHPSYSVQDSSAQAALNQMQDAFSEMNEKSSAMQDEMKKKK